MNPRDLVHGRFEIDRLAGRGGMGTVYRAIDRHTGGPVAVKVILGSGAEHTARFEREAAVLADLRHPGIVRFVASGATEQGEAFLVMDWLEGEGLDERVARGPLSVPETMELAWRVSSALAVAHARGVVHRDLKPSNLFLVGGSISRVTLLDFGIARTGGGQSLTRTGQTLGSPGYTSPEQARGERALDARADVFSLGCVIFKCLTGEAPFTGELLEVLLKVVTEPAPLASSRRPDVPHALESLIQRMLAKSPDARPPDAAAVAAELAALASPPPLSLPPAAHRSLEQAPRSVAPSSPPRPVVGSWAPPPPGPARPPPRSRVPALVLLGVVVFLVITATVVAVLLFATSATIGMR